MMGTIANLENEKKQLESEIEAERQHPNRMQAALDSATAEPHSDLAGNEYEVQATEKLLRELNESRKINSDLVLRFVINY